MAGRAPDERRKFFRLHYPGHLNSRLRIYTREYRVIEVSEGGVVIIPREPREFETGESICGFVHFLAGSTALIDGRVLRFRGDGSVVIQLWKHIPLKSIHEEERFLIERGELRTSFLRGSQQKEPSR